MTNRQFPFVLFIAGLLMSQSLYAVAQSATMPEETAGKKDNPPRPKPTPGPRDGDE